MKQLTFASALFFISLHCFAQKNFTAGYVVKINGDTVRGYLQEETREELLLKIKFKTDNANSAFQTFTPSDITVFKFASGNLYKAITFANTLEDSSKSQTCFALLLAEGPYNLFSYMANEKIYFVVVVNGISYLLYDSEYSNNGDLKVEGNYVSRLAVLDSACDTYVLHPEQVTYNEKAIAKFISDLNKCVSPNTLSVNNYKKPKTNVGIVLFAGGLPLGKQSQITLDGAAKLTYPQLSKNISFNIGIHYSVTNHQKNETDIYGYVASYHYNDYLFSVPFTVQHNFTSGIIQPFLYVGFAGAYLKENVKYYYNSVPISTSSTSKFGVSVIGAVGVEGHITRKLYVKAEWRYELLVQYPAIGLAYTF